MGFVKTGWWKRDWIKSDEGFSIEAGRDILVYREGRKAMRMTIDLGPKTVVLFKQTVGRWDDDLAHACSEDDVERIVDNIKRAVESQGYVLSLL